MDVEAIYRRKVYWISPTESLLEAGCRMRTDDVGSLVVLDGRKHIGIITERDLIQAIADGVSLATAKVASYMTDDPITVALATGVGEAAAEMLETEVRHLPVALGGDVVGMVSVRDLLNVVVEQAS